MTGIALSASTGAIRRTAQSREASSQVTMPREPSARQVTWSVRRSLLRAILMTGIALAAATVAVLVAIGLTAMPQGAQPAATFPTPSPSSLPSPVPPPTPIAHR